MLVILRSRLVPIVHYVTVISLFSNSYLRLRDADHTVAPLHIKHTIETSHSNLCDELGMDVYPLSIDFSDCVRPSIETDFDCTSEHFTKLHTLLMRSCILVEERTDIDINHQKLDFGTKSSHQNFPPYDGSVIYSRHTSPKQFSLRYTPVVLVFP